MRNQRLIISVARACMALALMLGLNAGCTRMGTSGAQPAAAASTASSLKFNLKTMQFDQINDLTQNPSFSDDDLLDVVVQIASLQASIEIADPATVAQVQTTVDAISSQAMPTAMVSYKMVSVNANEELPGWEAGHVIDGNGSTSYSSGIFGTSQNDRNIGLAAWMDGSHPVNELLLTPRMLNGQPMGFPLTYTIFLTTPDGSSWMNVGSYSIQPDPNGNLFIDLSHTYVTAAVMIVPNVLGTDNYGSHYFQLNEMSLGFGPSSASTGLTCWIPGISASLPTAIKSIAGSSVISTIGLTTELGGIGTNFSVSNNGSTVELLSPRSVGGAGWSTTYYTTDENDNAYSFNQGAGNEVQMWGFHTEMSDLTQTNWVPLYSDHLQLNADFNAPQHNTSPCAPATNPLVHEAGQTSVTGSTLSSPAGHQIVHWESQYAYMALQDEHFKTVNADQALYLDRAVARRQNMRVYLVAADHSWIKTIHPVDMSTDFNSVTGEQLGGCGSINCATHSSPLAYTVLVYNIGGQDVGIAIHMTNGDPMQAQVNLETATGCVGSDGCGIVNFHTWLDPDAWNPPAGDFVKGQIRRYSVSYEIGTLSELAEMGFGIN